MASVFLCCCTLERETGTIPYLPVEIRRKVFRFLMGRAVFTCRRCPRVLCETRIQSYGSYVELTHIERLCIDCFSCRNKM